MSDFFTTEVKEVSAEEHGDFEWLIADFSAFAFSFSPVSGL